MYFESLGTTILAVEMVHVCISSNKRLVEIVENEDLT